MLAAHRNGGRTDFGSFARAWDAYTGAKKPRRASTREVRMLTSSLELALARDGVAPPETIESGWSARSLAEEVRDVQATRRRLAESEAHEDTGITIEELFAEAEASAERGALSPERADAAAEPEPGELISH